MKQTNPSELHLLPWNHKAQPQKPKSGLWFWSKMTSEPHPPKSRWSPTRSVEWCLLPTDLPTSGLSQNESGVMLHVFLKNILETFPQDKFLQKFEPTPHLPGTAPKAPSACLHLGTPAAASQLAGRHPARGSGPRGLAHIFESSKHTSSWLFYHGCTWICMCTDLCTDRIRHFGPGCWSKWSIGKFSTQKNEFFGSILPLGFNGSA